MAKQTRQTRLQAILDKLSDAMTELEELRDEVREAVDNVEGTPLANTEAHQRRSEAAYTLDTAFDDLESLVSGDLSGIEF